MYAAEVEKLFNFLEKLCQVMHLSELDKLNFIFVH